VQTRLLGFDATETHLNTEQKKALTAAKQHISIKTFDKTETPLAAVLLGGEEKVFYLSSLFVSCEDYWDPSWHKEFGVEEGRTSGLGPAKRKEHYLTAAPFHQFDGINAHCL
jgi:hypothetical protein